ncbi:hypothetical protein AAFF_G00347610 [Aldrovandia affinis]|uniref:Uncharacterized protein n=1 Tax=Aldrovandia affinis TaxID=143900 RepID=A0AAD7SKD1_9TELE|nr:hypothetical protein AAFF_G00347610 [Aldrovandia affinis]
MKPQRQYNGARKLTTQPTSVSTLIPCPPQRRGCPHRNDLTLGGPPETREKCCSAPRADLRSVRRHSTLRFPVRFISQCVSPGDDAPGLADRAPTDTPLGGASSHSRSGAVLSFPRLNEGAASLRAPCSGDARPRSACIASHRARNHSRSRCSANHVPSLSVP